MTAVPPPVPPKIVRDSGDAPEPCDACTSFRTLEPGAGHDASSAPVLICRRFEANMCPTMHRTAGGDAVTVPSEIVESAYNAVARDLCAQQEWAEDNGEERWYGWSIDDLSEFVANSVIAAVYGDIVEAARRDAEAVHRERRQRHLERITAERDAALAEIERLRAEIVEWRATNMQSIDYIREHRERAEAAEADRDRAVRDARRDALDQAAKAIEAMASDAAYHRSEVGLERAARVVAGLRDSEATT